MHAMVSVLKHSLVITGFVAITMLVIEYLNVLSRGEWQEKLGRRRWGQYLLAAFLGATPGLLALGKGIVGQLRGSPALTADAVHSLADMLAIFASWRSTRCWMQAWTRTSNAA